MDQPEEKRFTAIFQSRAFGETVQPVIDVTVERFSFFDQGGCDAAELSCKSDDMWELFSLMNRLRQPVEIRDSNDCGGH